MLTGPRILKLFEELNEELNSMGSRGEIYLVGGAVMCLVYKARLSTRDIDALFLPAKKMRRASRRVAENNSLPNDWLNDAVKGFLSKNEDWRDYLKLSSLTIYTPTPEYVLAMKCLAMRIGEEFHDIDDVRFLLRYLNIETYDKAIAIIAKYYPLKRFPQKTLYALEELLDLRSAG